MELKQIPRDGITYELITPELFARDSGLTIIVNEDTGEKRVRESWEYRMDELAPAWRVDESSLPQDPNFEEQMQRQGRTEIYHKVSGQPRAHYKVDGPPPEDYVVATRYEPPKDGRRNLLAEAQMFFNEQDDFIPLHPETGQTRHEKRKLNQFDMGSIVDWPTGELNYFHCLTARRDGRLIGILTFKMGEIQPDGSRFGLVDRGFVKKTDRKTANRQEGEGASPADYLMRLAISELVTEFHCTWIGSEAVSLQGARFSERNGFRPSKATPMCNRILDEQIIREIQKFSRAKENDSRTPWEKLPELIDAVSPRIQEVAAEIRAELERESAVTSEQRT